MVSHMVPLQRELEPSGSLRCLDEIYVTWKRRERGNLGGRVVESQEEEPGHHDQSSRSPVHDLTSNGYAERAVQSIDTSVEPTH